MHVASRRNTEARRLLLVAAAGALALCASAAAAPSDMPLDGEEILKLVAVGGGLILGALYIIFASTKSMVKAKEREQTKRELAAYIAEGSMRPEDAEKILKADIPIWEKDCKAWGIKD